MKELPVVDSFSDAADWFVGLAAAVPAGGWAENGLGDWTIRDLVGHTGRALSTVSEYATDRVETPELATSLDYYRGMALSGAGADDVNAAVAERGRQAGAELGDDPVGALTIMRDTVVALTRTVSPDSLATSRAGTIRRRDYLPTRTLELVVHGLDLQRALARLDAVGVPTAPAGALSDVFHLLADIAVDRGQLFLCELTMALTGRVGLPVGYSVL